MRSQITLYTISATPVKHHFDQFPRDQINRHGLQYNRLKRHMADRSNNDTPAKDHFHDTVKRALIKAGWAIIQEQVYLSDNQRHVWMDLSAQREDDERLILIEIKGFERNASLIDALMDAMGQYAVYQAMLDYLEMTEPLFLAVPQAAYEGIFQSPVAQQVIKNLDVRLIVFDPVSEAVVLGVP